MPYYDIPPARPLRALAEKLPSYVSIALDAAAREPLRVSRSPAFRTALGEVVSPPTTQVRIGPAILTIVWGRKMRSYDDEPEGI